MIPISFQQLFVSYLLVWLAGLMVLWLRELWRRKAHDWALSEGRLCICEDCLFAFLVKPGETVARCPRCQELCRVRQPRFRS